MLSLDQPIPEEEIPPFVPDDLYADEPQEALTGELLPPMSTALLAVDEADSTDDLMPEEARATHHQIKQGRELTKFLLLKMRDRHGWKTGFMYKSWEEYLSREFDAEDQRTFRRWVAHARVILRIAGKKSGHNVRNEKELALLPQISQAQALVLAKLPEELQASTYEAAKKAAEPLTYKGKASIWNGKLTTKLLTEIVDTKLTKLRLESEKAAQKIIPETDTVEADLFALSIEEEQEIESQEEALPVLVSDDDAPQLGSGLGSAAEPEEKAQEVSTMMRVPMPANAVNPSKYKTRYVPVEMFIEGDKVVLGTIFPDKEWQDSALVVCIADLRRLLAKASKR